MEFNILNRLSIGLFCIVGVFFIIIIFCIECNKVGYFVLGKIFDYV